MSFPMGQTTSNVTLCSPDVDLEKHSNTASNQMSGGLAAGIPRVPANPFLGRMRSASLPARSSSLVDKHAALKAERQSFEGSLEQKLNPVNPGLARQKHDANRLRQQEQRMKAVNQYNEGVENLMKAHLNGQMSYMQFLMSVAQMGNEILKSVGKHIADAAAPSR